MTVHWTTTATRVSVLGHNIVTQGSTGVCLNIEGTGQGVPIIAGVQQRVTAVCLHIARLWNPVVVRRGRSQPSSQSTGRTLFHLDVGPRR